MLLKEFFQNANWIAIGVAALSYFVLGAVWFSALFQKAWMAGHNLQAPTDEMKLQMKKHMPVMMVQTLVMNIVMAIVVAMLVMAMGSVRCVAGIKLGLALSAVGCVPLVMSHMYTMKSIKLWMVDAAYHTVGITLMSIIISVWHK